MINTLNTLGVLWCCDGFGCVVVKSNKKRSITTPLLLLLFVYSY